MKEGRRAGVRRHQYSWVLLLVTATLAISSYVSQVASYPTGVIPVNQWPTFPRRNIAALARDGYLRGFKRSISTLAKNGQLPTFRSPYGETDKEESDEEGSHEKRNMASIARLRSYAAMKRNIQALARDGHRMGRGQYNQQNDKRNVQSLARNGLIHKKDVSNDEEFYYPFYQPIPPQSDIEDPWMDSNEVYDLQQSVNPYMFPPLSQYTKRSADDASEFMNDNEMIHPGLLMSNWYLKRGAGGMPVHGLMRPTYVDPNVRTKRYILNLPEAIEHNDANESENEETDNSDKRSVDDETEVHDMVYEKRHIGSLARLGLLPTFRYTGSRYSRSGRARLFMPSQPLYRKHPDDENFGIREYITAPKIESAAYTDDANVPPEAVSTNSHPTGRFLHHRPLNNDLPSRPARPLPLPSRSYPPQKYDAFAKNRWLSTSKEFPKFYYFRSLKVPYHNSGKRYLTWPPVNNVLLRKSYPNSSLPSRQKNE